MKNSQEKLFGRICHAVAAMTVDRIMRDYALEKIDILKVDIEGAEREVFSCTSAWLDKVDAIIIELHDRMKAGCSRSFYHGTSGFDNEWRRGENVYVSFVLSFQVNVCGLLLLLSLTTSSCFAAFTEVMVPVSWLIFGLSVMRSVGMGHSRLHETGGSSR